MEGANGGALARESRAHTHVNITKGKRTDLDAAKPSTNNDHGDVRGRLIVDGHRSVCAVLVSSGRLECICLRTPTDRLAPRLPSYWDATANNWAFDYDAYNAAYGRPAAADPSTYDNATYQAQAYEQSQAYGQSSSGFNQFGPAAASGSTEAKKKVLPGPKDAMGNPIAGGLKKGETRETVLRKSVGKLYEDQTLLEWDPGKC